MNITKAKTYTRIYGMVFCRGLSTCVLEEARTYKVECKGGGGGSALKFKLDRPDIRFDHSDVK